jgi:hypothetical protein
MFYHTLRLSRGLNHPAKGVFMSIAQSPAEIPKPNEWPALPLAEWNATRETLHMWTQVIGKIRLALSPRENHWWEVPLYVSARGLTTSAIPYPAGVFEIEFDFIDHVLRVATCQGQTKAIPLAPKSVAQFYREVMDTLRAFDIQVKIWPVPVEIPNPIPFANDITHHSYDPVYANRLWRVLIAVSTVFKEFRARFIGKASPVHFFWGSFDLAATRFSGRRAPERPGADAITREAYSHEVISAGWWPGGGDIAEPMFYAYAAPEPKGFRSTAIRPAQASYNEKLNEFLLPYEAVRTASDPRGMLLDFLQSTYEAGAIAGNWDRAALERPISK